MADDAPETDAAVEGDLGETRNARGFAGFGVR